MNTDTTQPGVAPLRWDRRDLIALVALAAAHGVFVWWHTGFAITTCDDMFRDMSGAINYAAGRFGADPAIPGAPAWYPPLEPLLIGWLARLFDVSVLAVASSSRYWANVWIPLAVYVLMRDTWNRRVGLLAVLLVFIGSCWWHRLLVMPMPSGRGVVPLLLGLFAWQRAAGGSWGWRVGAGAALGVAAWHHPINALLLAGVFVCDSVWSWLAATAPVARHTLVMRAWQTALVATFVGGVSAWRGVTLPRENIVPLEYFAHELWRARYALQAHAPFVILLAAIGVVGWLRRGLGGRAMVCYLTLAMAGQLSGYAGVAWGWPTPVLVPHEFQWHAQLVIGCLAAVGLELLWRTAADRQHRRPSRLGSGAAVALVAIGLVSAALRLPPADARVACSPSRTHLLSRYAEAEQWIQAHTTLDTVLAADPMTSYRVVAGLNGRKVVTLPLGHANPAIDAAGRERDVDTMLTTREPDVLRRLLDKYGVDYLIVDDERPATLAEVIKPVLIDPVGGVWIYAVRAGTTTTQPAVQTNPS